MPEGFSASGAVPAGADRAAARADLLRHRVDRVLVAIDRLLARQLDAILHHPRFLRLEGSWRGISWLVRRQEEAGALRVRIVLLATSWRELDRDLARAIEFDQSRLFRLVYDNEFGHPGGEPFGLLVMDHEISHQPRPRDEGGPAPVDELSVLAGLAAVAAAAFAPVVVGASPALFGADDFEDIQLSGNIAGALNDQDHARWRSFATREDTRFVSVVPSRILARPRWRMTDAWRNGLRYEEQTPTPRERTWFPGAYAFAGCVTRAVRRHAWPADVRGLVTDQAAGGLVVDLPEDRLRLGPETEWRRPSLYLGLTETQERLLVQAGFMPLNTLPYGDAFFASARSLQTEWVPAAGREVTPMLANRRLSAQINAILTASRFAHYIKMIGRDLVGSFLPPELVEQRLQNWLINYVNSNETAGLESRARYPLRSAMVSVNEIAGRPGSYGCIIHLQPHYQLDDVATTFRLVTSFVAPATGAAVG